MKAINLENIQEVVAAIDTSICVRKKEVPVGMYDIDAPPLYHEQIQEVLRENFEGLILVTKRFDERKLTILFSNEFLDHVAPKIKEKTGTTESLDKVKYDLFMEVFGKLMPASPLPVRLDLEFPFKSPFDKTDASLN